ncbi:hypothetical protein PGTUg99_027141 [Puccinia graminis f. sp. tritici]|uniref:Uncharacterized protein n=1 Tax=Puccinia graminis f. sp. tritici TaxID=56615 RepID=A0A5B0Q1W4_PUCGR|nr:hypothetical protein PGTUg99_027141 [Puccinia graminis f. sp. tritici]
MKATFPCIFLVILTVLLATPVMGWFKEKSAPVAPDPLVKGWTLGPGLSKDDPEAHLIIANGHGLKFHPSGSGKWMVENEFKRRILIRVHIKDNDGKLIHFNVTLGARTYYTNLDIPHSKGLIPGLARTHSHQLDPTTLCAMLKPSALRALEYIAGVLVPSRKEARFFIFEFADLQVEEYLH